MPLCPKELGHYIPVTFYKLIEAEWGIYVSVN